MSAHLPFRSAVSAVFLFKKAPDPVQIVGRGIVGRVSVSGVEIESEILPFIQLFRDLHGGVRVEDPIRIIADRQDRTAYPVQLVRHIEAADALGKRDKALKLVVGDG